MKKIALVAVVVVTAALSAGAATANVPSKAGVLAQKTTAAPGTVGVRFTVNRFIRRGNKLIAKGSAIATYTSPTGEKNIVRKAYTARVSVRGGARTFSTQRICQVLSLRLGPLSLNLLGLHVDLDTVNLRITADSEGGLLGSLLCSVAGTQAGLMHSTARLTKAVQRSGLATKGVAFAVPLQSTAQLSDLPPPAPCPVLDLMLGPLDLNLLGLRVQLSMVHLRITADPEGGILGSLLCSLSGGPVPTP